MLETRYIFVIGGVLSGIGKGIVTSSIAKMFQKRNYKVTVVKIDPYINIDAGTMRPTEHGEVWVTDDGGEIDEDFGHYERFLDINLSKKNNITTGQIYFQVIKNERAGKYLGKTVQFIPHIPEETERRIKECAKGYDICIVEIGGTIGDYENIPFIFAAKSISLKNRSVFLLLSYLPKPPHLGEVKSKPTQHAIKELRQLGIHPDYIIARAEEEIDEIRKQKIAISSNIDSSRIISDPDIDTIYRIPLVFEKQDFCKKLCKNLDLEYRDVDWSEWEKLLESPKKQVNIAMICKYIDIGNSKLPDSYVSVNEALKNAGRYIGVNVNIDWIDAKDLKNLSKYDGILVPGGFGISGIEGKINAIKYARENNKPFLGLCLGMQLAVVEFARNVCKLESANSTEIDPDTKYPVVDILPEQKEIIKNSKYGATMRLGGQFVYIKSNTKAWNIYGKNKIKERFRHRYEINPDYTKILEEKGIIFSGYTKDKRIMQILELKNHKFFIAVQFHPEFTSRFENPNPLFLGFVKACCP